jgi:hypothetical protein
LLAITSQSIYGKEESFLFFSFKSLKRRLVVDATKSSKFKYRKEESPFLHFMTNLKRITGGVIIQGFMPAKDIGQKSP